MITIWIFRYLVKTPWSKWKVQWVWMGMAWITFPIVHLLQIVLLVQIIVYPDQITEIGYLSSMPISPVKCLTPRNGFVSSDIFSEKTFFSVLKLICFETKFFFKPKIQFYWRFKCNHSCYRFKHRHRFLRNSFVNNIPRTLESQHS